MPELERLAALPAGTTAAALEALLDLHLEGVRRHAAAIRAADPKGLTKRPDEACWCCAAVALGALRGRRVTHKDLVAMAEGRLSPATLSRAVQDAVLLGLMRQEEVAGNRRVKRLILTEAGWRMLSQGADAAFAAAAAAVHGAQARGAAA
ncbi:MAG: hypothetical protein ACK4PG_17485 [Acetobacteraceae bacterium]